MKNSEKDIDFSEKEFKKQFRQIDRSHRPNAAIDKGLLESKVISSSNSEETEEIFAVCLETDDTKLLVPFKIYRVALRGEYARVIDERGEAAVYPKNFFLPLPLPAETANALSSAYTHIG
jgi:hypothetical protein